MKKYFSIANVLILTGIIFFSVKVFYKITTADLDPAFISKKAPGSASNAQNQSAHRPSNYDLIAERNLFKTQKARGRPAQMVDIENLKPTALNLKLLGTVAGDKDQAYAVIRNNEDNLENLYKIGDSIQNATLKIILREKVVLLVDGKNEILEIEEDAQPAKRRPYLSRPSTQNYSSITLERSRIETAVKDVNTLMQQARIRPHFADGKPDGLRLTGVRPNSIFYDMGLKSGDILTGIDGRNIESVDDALKLYQDLRSASRVKLELKRRGQVKTIDYYIK